MTGTLLMDMGIALVADLARVTAERDAARAEVERLTNALAMKAIELDHSKSATQTMIELYETTKDKLNKTRKMCGMDDATSDIVEDGRNPLCIAAKCSGDIPCGSDRCPRPDKSLFN